MWRYVQATGELFDSAGHCEGVGYSGFGAAKNDPAMERMPNMGPIPKGVYIIGEPFDSPDHGPFVLRLTPTISTNTFGRSGFLMHGDSIDNPGKASHGCIIQARSTREKVHQSGDSTLEVV